MLLGITGAIFLIVEITLLTFVIRYRRRGRRRDAEPEQIAGETRIEVIWTVIPVLILAVIVGSSFTSCPGSRTRRRQRAGAGRASTSTSKRTSSTGCSSTRRARVDQRAHGAPGPGRHARRHRRRTSRTAGGSRRSAARSTRSPARRTTRGSRRRRPATTRSAAPSSAGSSTRRCAASCRSSNGEQARSLDRGPARQAGVQASARRATASSGEGLVGPAIATSPTLQDPKALAHAREGRLRQDARSRQYVGREQLINALIAYLKTQPRRSEPSGG